MIYDITDYIGPRVPFNEMVNFIFFKFSREGGREGGRGAKIRKLTISLPRPLRSPCQSFYYFLKEYTFYISSRNISSKIIISKNILKNYTKYMFNKYTLNKSSKNLFNIYIPSRNKIKNYTTCIFKNISSKKISSQTIHSRIMYLQKIYARIIHLQEI